MSPAAAEMALVEQRRGGSDSAHWILEGGRRRPAAEDNRRVEEVRAGLLRHPGVRPGRADAETGAVEETLARLHAAEYLDALWSLDSAEPVVMPEMAAPGLAPDIPVCAGLVAAAREGARTAISGAARLLGGARYSYALCRPPGHHAGPDWFAGYCYLNSAAAAALTLGAGGMGPVGILDLDLHYPNGTAAIAASMEDVRLHSLHAWPVTNVAAGTVTPSDGRERVVEFRGNPEPDAYLEALADSVATLAGASESIVVSLGYDTVAGDPHGSWDFGPEIFARVGRALAGAGRPLCVVQEGGYALPTLAACAHAFATGLLDAGGRRDDLFGPPEQIVPSAQEEARP